MLANIKRISPWYFKLLAKLLLARLPVAYSTWSRISLFKHGYMEQPEYVYRVVREHVKRLKPTPVKDLCVLEIGPGDTLLSALVHYAMGFKSTILVDEGSYARTDFEPYNLMIHYLEKQEYELNALKGIDTVEELLQKIDARYLTHGLDSMKEIPDSSIDVIWSQAVLEHIGISEFDEYLVQMRRILKPDGLCSHRVDLKDHLGGALNNLRFSRKLWESDFFSKSGFYTNRIRYTDMLNRFRAAGFEILWVSEDRWEEVPTPMKKLDMEFRNLDVNELSISGFDIVLRPA
jgi:SAM-dependent methyltransferase